MQTQSDQLSGCIHIQAGIIFIQNCLGLGGFPFSSPQSYFGHVLSPLHRMKGYICFKKATTFTAVTLFISKVNGRKSVWCISLSGWIPPQTLRAGTVEKLMSFHHRFSLETLHTHQRGLLREIERENYCYHGNIPERRFIVLPVFSGTPVSLHCLRTC